MTNRSSRQRASHCIGVMLVACIIAFSSCSSESETAPTLAIMEASELSYSYTGEASRRLRSEGIKRSVMPAMRE